MREAAKVERLVEIFDCADLAGGQVALVVLHYQRDRTRIESFVGEIGVKVLETLDVLRQLARLAVGDRDDTVDSLQHQLSRRGIVYLPGERVQLIAGLESCVCTEVESSNIVV